jgi:hypothetical protein
MPPAGSVSKVIGEHKANMYNGLVTEERKYAILFAATILAARKLADLGDLADRPCPARETVIRDAVSKAEMILRKIDSMYPKGS